MIRAAALLVLAISTLAAAPAAAKSWPPKDQCGHLDGADEFRRVLTTAVANRDEAMLLSVTDADIHLDFGGGSGTAELVRRLDAEPYFLWRELDALLRLGCATFDDETMVMPYHFAQEIDEVDGVEGMLVLGTGVPLRSAADTDAAVVTTLSWSVVQLAGEWNPEARFLKVAVPGGPTGYVEQARLRSLIDYRLLARRFEGRWTLSTLIAGD